MSTRCNILFKVNGEEWFWLYHHHDGYPEGVGAWLVDYLTRETNGFTIWPDTMANDLIKNKAGLNDDGYELTSGQHGDIEFLYTYDYRYIKDAESDRIREYDVSLRVDGIYENIHETLWSFKKVDE